MRIIKKNEITIEKTTNGNYFLSFRNEKDELIKQSYFGYTKKQSIDLFLTMLNKSELTVKEIESETDFHFVSDSQDVKPIKDYIGKKAKEFDSFFVEIESGDYERIYGMYGIVALHTKMLYRLK